MNVITCALDVVSVRTFFAKPATYFFPKKKKFKCNIISYLESSRLLDFWQCSVSTVIAGIPRPQGATASVGASRSTNGTGSWLMTPTTAHAGGSSWTGSSFHRAALAGNNINEAFALQHKAFGHV